MQFLDRAKWTATSPTSTRVRKTSCTLFYIVKCIWLFLIHANLCVSCCWWHVARKHNCQLTFLKTRQLFPDSRLLVSRKLEKNLAHRQSRESHSIVQNCTSLVFVMLRCLQPVPITKICSKAAITVSFSKFFSTHNPATERKMTALELQHLARKGENSCSSFC